MCLCFLFREQAALEDFLELDSEPSAKPPHRPHSSHDDSNRYVGFGNVPQKPETESFNAFSSFQSVSAGSVDVVWWLV